MNKLQNFPRTYYMSLEESVDRQKNLTDQFKQYGITPIPIISKRFSESNDKVTGKYLHQLNDGTKGCAISHLKAIRKWYETTDEDYAFFCEDDLSLETVQYWNFTWEEFIASIPEDAECVQLLTIRNDFESFSIRDRLWNDWGATAYIITRDYAKKLIDNYIKDDIFHLQVPNSDIMPLIENILFTNLGKSYTIPLFVENIEFDSTFSTEQDNDVNDGQKNNHRIANEKVLNYWKSKNMLDTSKTELEELLSKYSLDTENPIYNFNLGVWYENEGHTAPALSYFLRCAERSEDNDLAYEALIRGSYCYDKQGTRDGSAKSLLEQALCLMPKRPEAYFLLSRFAERRQWWQDCYIYADQGLMFADHESHNSLLTDVEYPGKYGLLFEKSISGYWWGKNDECKEILLDIRQNYLLSHQYLKVVDENLTKMGIDINTLNINCSDKLSDIFDVSKHNTDKNDLGYIDNFYDRLFVPIKNIPIKMMEIGVYNGGSIRLWREYLHPESEIYAAEINYFEHIDGTCSVIGDMYSDEQVSKFSDEYFDLIIDDGPHSFESFVLLMQRYYSKIKSGGTLVVEDIIYTNWVKPLVELSSSLGYSHCEVIDMTGKQKTLQLLDDWKNGLYILKITK